MFQNKAFWWVALFVNMGLGAWWHTCRIKELCDTAARVTVTAPDLPATAAAPGLRLADGDRLSLTAPGNFNFARAGADLNLDAVRVQADSLALYLKNNPDRKLTITGLYASAEANRTRFDNLGLARADALKRFLVRAGAPTTSITTEGRKVDDLTFLNDSLRGGLGFDFTGTPLSNTEVAKPLAETEEGLAKAEKFAGDVFKPLDLYFPVGRTDFIRTPDNQQFLAEAQKYLAAHPDKRLALTGHTDSEGPDATNLRLSKRRAEAVKTRFRRLGIPAAQLATDGKGETQPKASNTTAAGRRANRRVSIVVQ